tara:strand:- start:3686 stop:3928 length:243 start_codon:yes stop_codon:yes gene_type:complete
MDPLPTIEEILQETQDAMRSVTGSSSQYRDRYGHVVFTEAMRTNLLLRLLTWAQSGPDPETNAAMVAQLGKIAEAIYRSA